MLLDHFLNTFHKKTGYFGAADPVGTVGLTLLIVPGVHARLSDICASGNFIPDEQFEVAGKITIRKKGTSVKGLMKKWVELRSKCPEMFVGFSIVQQPAAVTDGAVQHWRIRELSAQYGRSIWQRDTLATHMTSEAYQSMSLGWMLQSLILGKMTPVLQLTVQLTDTDIAFIFKAEGADIAFIFEAWDATYSDPRQNHAHRARIE